MTAPVLEGQLDILEALQELHLAQTRENLPPPPYMPGEPYADVPADLVCPDCGHQAPNVIVYQINHLQMPLGETCTYGPAVTHVTTTQ